MKLLCFLLIAVPYYLEAATSEDQKRVFRLCYSQLVHKRVSPTHPIYQRVVAGTLSGAKGCVALLESAYLQSDNKIASLPNGEIDWEKQKIIQTLFDIHHQPFSKILGQKKIYNWDSDVDSNAAHDESEMATHFVYSIFKKGIPFSDSVRRKFPVQGIRYSETDKLYPFDVMMNLMPTETAIPEMKASNAGYEVCTRNDGSGGCAEWSKVPSQVRQGLLIGVEPKAQPPGAPRFYKAGALGAPAYVFLNLPPDGSPSFKGGVAGSPRNFAASFFREFLCRSLPVIRPNDASDYARKDAAPEFTFIGNSKCVQCHASIEPMTYLLRNKYVSRQPKRFTLPYPGGELVRTRSAMTVFDSISSDPNRFNINPDGEMVTQKYEWFRVSNPVGRLRYRSATGGEFIDEKVVDLEGLGEALASQQDFYACSMKRYVEYFTGLKAPLFDDYQGTPSNPNPFEQYQNPFDNSLRAFIFELASDLQNHPEQNLLPVLEKLFANQIYLTPEKGVIKDLQ